MAKLRFEISISLDGYVAGPNQSEEHPLGEGGMQLHEWIIKLAAWREPHGREGGEVNASTPLVEEAQSGIGEPPFDMPIFVLTHHERQPLTLGGTTFTFVTDGIESALEQARQAAGDQDVTIGGGADVARQFLSAGLVDQMQLNVVPVLLGDGARLFEDGAGAGLGLEPILVVDTPEVAHLRYRIG